MLLTALALLDSGADDVVTRIAAIAVQAERLIPRLEAEGLEAETPQRVVFIGTGPLQFAAREAALKVMELSAGKIAALWDSTLGFRHGPKSFVGDGTRIFLFQSSERAARRYEEDLAAEVRRQFPDAGVTTIGPGSDLTLDPGPDAWNAVLYVLLAQIFGVIWSARLGYNPDDPFEGLGTLTRVVSGVRLYDPVAE